MLKGVNRKIIEVRDPDSRYFERAILFVRQGDWAPKEIDEQAEQYLRAASEEMGRSLAVRHPAQGAGRTQKAAVPGRGGGRAAAAGSGAGAALRQSGTRQPAISRISQILIKPPVDHGSAGGFCLERL